MKGRGRLHVCVHVCVFLSVCGVRAGKDETERGILGAALERNSCALLEAGCDSVGKSHSTAAESDRKRERAAARQRQQTKINRNAFVISLNLCSSCCCFTFALTYLNYIY